MQGWVIVTLDTVMNIVYYIRKYQLNLKLLLHILIVVSFF